MQSLQPKDEAKKHMQSADHTVYSQNFQKQRTMLEERPPVNNFGQVPNYDKNNVTTQSIGNKMWLPGFNMTASSIKSEQSVRVSKEPAMQTPVQYTNKITNERRSDRTLQNTGEKSLNYTPEVHQAKPRNFGNINNPSMTAHSMNVASTNLSSMPNTVAKSPISQIDKYDENKSTNSVYNMSEYDNSVTQTRLNDYRSDKSKSKTENHLPSKGPIKPVNYGGMNTQSSMQTEMLPTGYNNFDDNISESRQHRYSQHSNKSLETRNRNKNSFSQK